METKKFPNPSLYPILPQVNDSITTYDHNHEELTQQEYKSWRLKTILPQCFAALAIFIVSFSASSIAPIFWGSETVLYRLITYLGLIVGGVLAHIIGGRKIIIFSGVVLTLSSLSITWISSVIMKWIDLADGFLLAILEGPCYVYLAEITQPNLRSSLMAAIYLASMVGSVFHFYLMNMNVSSEAEIWIKITFSIIGVILMIFLPESPYWLANKGRYHESELSLAWFRGRSIISNFKSESNAVINNAQNSPVMSKYFKSKSLYIPLLIIFIVSTICSVIKINNLKSLCNNLWLDEFELAEDKMFLLVNVLPVILFVFLVAIAGEKIMILISLFGCSIGLFLTTTYDYLYENNILDVNRWLLAVSTSVTVFFFQAGIAFASLLLNAELFPLRIRNLGVGFGLVFIKMTYDIFMVYDYDYLTIPAFVSILGFILLFWLLPNNKNKTLVEIEQSASSINNLRRKK